MVRQPRDDPQHHLLPAKVKGHIYTKPGVFAAVKNGAKQQQAYERGQYKRNVRGSTAIGLYRVPAGCTQEITTKETEIKFFSRFLKRKGEG